MDYEKIGFKAGLEIHQQLDTHKLFCNCQSVITEYTNYSFERFLRPTQSELGDLDKAALAEAKRDRNFLYTASNKSTCLVEADEEPPHSVNEEALHLCITMAILLDAKTVDEVHFMRKIVIDGSNTGGFQRTALLAMDGKIQDVGIQTIALEEDAARKIEEKGKLVNYGLDRLGIPLIEIATAADIKNPQHAREVAERIGLLLRATGRVKRGLGTIRQDLNISISKGARVEIKGVQSLSSISTVAENETLRQLGLVEIKETLDDRVNKRHLENIEVVDITSLLNDCKSKVVKKLIENDGCAKAIKLPGFNGLLKQDRTRLGREFALYAKMASGIGGIIHSDELPGYGIENNDMENIRKILNTGNNDAFVIAVGKEDIVDSALQAVVERARKSLEGVLEEVRRALPDDTTEYMRPLPGAARMYPETDVQPVRITLDLLQKMKKNLPERPEEKRRRFIEEYKLNAEQTKQILASGYEKDFERLVKRFPEYKNVIIRTFLNTFPELEAKDVDIGKITEDVLIDVFSAFSKDRYSKEAIPKILKCLAQNSKTTLENAIKSCGLGTTDATDIEEIIRKIVSERIEFVKQRGMDALGPLMGIVMKELRGKADGKLINKILKQEIEKVIRY